MVQCGELSIVDLNPEHWAEPLILKARPPDVHAAAEPAF